MLSESLARLPVLTWNGGPDSQDWIWVVVCFTWLTSAGYSASTRLVTSQTAAPMRMNASSRVHQVAASGPKPRRRSRCASGCSSAVSSSAAANGTMTR